MEVNPKLDVFMKVALESNNSRSPMLQLKWTNFNVEIIRKVRQHNLELQ